MKKSQMFTLIITIILSIVIIIFLLSIYLIGNITSYNEASKEHKEELTEFLSILLETYYLPDVHMNLKDALMYISLNKGDSTIEKNIRDDIKNLFNRLLGNRWHITIYKYTVIDAWIVKAKFAPAKPWDYDSSIYPDYSDKLGIKWYQPGYNDKDWINVTLPFYQGRVIERILLYGAKIEDLSKLYPSIFKYKGVYLIKNKFISPINVLRSLEACYYPGDRDKPEITISSNPDILPRDVDYSGYAYYKIVDRFCSVANNYRELRVSIFKGEITYNTITNISDILHDLNIKDKLVVTYMRGWFYVPNSCKNVYLEAIWNEIFRLYINGKFIFATCYNNIPGPLYKLPEDFCKPNPKFNCIKGTPTWGILRVNLTKYIKKGSDNLIAILFGVPHNKNTIPDCFPNIKNYMDISLNTLASLRIFCIDENGEVLELNRESILPPKRVLDLGYPIPKTSNIYTTQTVYFQKTSKFSGNVEYYVIKLFYW